MEPLFNPLTKKHDAVPPGGYRYSTDRLAELVADNRIHFHTDGSLPTIKRYLDENMMQRPKSIMSDDQRPDYAWLKKNNLKFDNPKQLSFMKRILSIFDKDALILDFFSGSGTTAHAVMELNYEDSGNRKWIMVQLPEVVNQKDYKTICDIALSRISIAGDEIVKNNSNTLFKNDLDVGFKVFKLSSSNIIPWDNEQELDDKRLAVMTNEVFKSDRTKEDVLYEIMLKYGIFDQKVTEVSINNKILYQVGRRHMIVCLENDITSDDVNAIAELKPKSVVFKESGFKNDNDKINAVYNLEKAGVEDIKCI